MDFICEHVVERKKKGLYRFYGLGVILAWILSPIILIAICFGLSAAIPGPLSEMFKWSMFMIPVFVFLGLKIGPITYAYTNIAYEYSITLGEIAFAKIFSDRFRREWFTIKISEFEIVAPYSGSYKSDAERGSYSKVIRAVSSMSAPHIYFATFKNSKNQNCILLFEMTKKSQRLFKTFNPSTVITDIRD